MFRNRDIAMTFILTTAICGCGRQETHEKYVPAADAARLAVEAAMVDWTDGRPPGAITRLKPSAQVVDTHRKAGQTLESFEILGEVPANATRCFAVRVKLKNPEVEERIRFCVLGIDPLWVFRQEDYEMLAHWDHPMPGPDEKEKAGASTEETGSEEKNESKGKNAETRESTAAEAEQPEC